MSISQDNGHECKTGAADAVDHGVDNPGARDDVADDGGTRDDVADDDRAADTGVVNDDADNDGAGDTDDNRVDNRRAGDGSKDHEFATALDDEITSDGDLEHFISTFFGASFPNPNLSAADAIIGIITYGVSASLNWSNMEGLLNLVNFLFGKDVLPSSKFLLRKIWCKLKERMTKHHFFCKECGTHVGGESQDEPCPNCQAVVPRRNFSQRNFFTTLDMKLQLEILLADKGIAQELFQALQKNAAGDKTMRDLTDGALYKKQTANSSWSDITLTFNTDGARVFNSNKSSLWPVQCVINELPVLTRWSNVLLGGLWFGAGHPDMVMFLNEFVEEINRIGTIAWECDGHLIESRVQVICSCVDAPARAAVLNMKQYNGYYGCTWCFQKGTYLNGSMKYPVQEDGAVAAERTPHTSRRDIEAALQQGQPSHGVKGPTPLMNAPGLDLVWGVNPDYLHCVLEGVTKQMCESWLSSTQLECYIGSPRTLETIDRRLLQLTPPQWFTRLPRSLVDRPVWKASEWKWWLLHYAIPCLEGILPTKYLEHFCLLVSAIYLLLKDAVEDSDVAKASDMLAEFVVKTQLLYGTAAMTFNVHQLLHLAKSVQQLGPLWSHSTFIFESGNGTLLQLVSDANGVPLQILERFAMRVQLKRIPNKSATSAEVCFYHGSCPDAGDH
ncbi:hypothetical protein HPB47_017557 [Ixodes persulcatus]|uniref:Uncharacterized protein n=1 Tax=Ixodes persulcatus TaxID=34615 RepID=A0AC60QRN4_IXOPE|nr:hypothetical protein HPB47_017557 [Ixodes persulcatus]